MNGPYALITTAVSADLVGLQVKPLSRFTELHPDGVFVSQGTHESLRGNSRALSTVTAIIDGTGSIGTQREFESDFI